MQSSRALPSHSEQEPGGVALQLSFARSQMGLHKANACAETLLGKRLGACGASVGVPTHGVWEPQVAQAAAPSGGLVRGG